MNYQTVLWVLFVLLLIILSIFGKKASKGFKISIGALMVIIFLVPMILPRQIFGKWNSISKLTGKTIAKILLQPSDSKYDVNLVASDKIIYDKNQIDTLTHFLQNSEVYFPTHPSRIWETKMLFITTSNDTLEIEINKTSNNGTVIYTASNDWRKDDIGNYLERITNYKKPVFGDTTIKPIDKYY